MLCLNKQVCLPENILKLTLRELRSNTESNGVANQLQFVFRDIGRHAGGQRLSTSMAAPYKLLSILIKELCERTRECNGLQIKNVNQFASCLNYNCADVTVIEWLRGRTRHATIIIGIRFEFQIVYENIRLPVSTRKRSAHENIHLSVESACEKMGWIMCTSAGLSSDASIDRDMEFRYQWYLQKGWFSQKLTHVWIKMHKMLAALVRTAMFWYVHAPLGRWISKYSFFSSPSRICKRQLFARDHVMCLLSRENSTARYRRCFVLEFFRVYIVFVVVAIIV